jgi:hypothetical protein
VGRVKVKEKLNPRKEGRKGRSPGIMKGEGS